MDLEPSDEGENGGVRGEVCMGGRDMTRGDFILRELLVCFNKSVLISYFGVALLLLLLILLLLLPPMTLMGRWVLGDTMEVICMLINEYC